MTPELTQTWTEKIRHFVEAQKTQNFIIGVIIFNAILLGLETNHNLMATWGSLLIFFDRICLAIFVLELGLKLLAYHTHFFKDGWNVFDFLVIAIAFAPGAGAWSVLRSLRVLRVLRLLSAVPTLRKVVAALLHAIPGLFGVMAIMAILFYTAAVLATQLFGEAHPAWFGSIGHSFYTLFQIMTLESWSMGIVRPVMETHPWAWAFFVPFIIIATFTILNLFLGIIVSTIQELSLLPDPLLAPEIPEDVSKTLENIEKNLKELKASLEKKASL